MDELLNLSINSENNRKDETKISNEEYIKNNILVNIYLVLSPFILYILLKRYIPETVPKHSNMIGVIDAWGNSNMVFYSILAFSSLALIFVYIIIKYKQYEVGPFSMIIFFYTNSITALFATYQNINYTKNLYDISWTFEKQFTVIIAFIFLIYGVFAHKIKKNFFIGLRTKWSMSSEKVWKQTHRKSRIYSLLISGLNLFILLNPAIKDSHKLIMSSISIVLLTMFLIILSYREYLNSSKNS